MTVHLLKLCVGVDSVEMLRDAQAARLREEGGVPYVTGFTRRKPRRASEIAGSGSLYWVIRGVIRVRQRILDFADATDADGQVYCELRFEPELVETEPRAHRAFQGWRYLSGKDAPADLRRVAGDDILPAELAEELRFLGLL